VLDPTRNCGISGRTRDVAGPFECADVANAVRACRRTMLSARSWAGSSMAIPSKALAHPLHRSVDLGSGVGNALVNVALQ
jgi:hypothetical protein